MENKPVKYEVLFAQLTCVILDISVLKERRKKERPSTFSRVISREEVHDHLIYTAKGKHFGYISDRVLWVGGWGRWSPMGPLRGLACRLLSSVSLCCVLPGAHTSVPLGMLGVNLRCTNAPSRKTNTTSGFIQYLVSYNGTEPELVWNGTSLSPVSFVIIIA